MICHKCGDSNPDEAQFCLNCGERFEDKKQISSSPISHSVVKRYPSLRRIATVYLILGIILNFIVLYIAIRVFQTTGLSSALVILFIGAIPTTMVCSNGERIKVSIDTEENTRRTAEYMRQILETIKK